jgi:peptidoglycan L-alanyl-D-glutamate endopeptidase CwlK
MKTLASSHAAGLPFSLFAGFRTRERQAALYAQGRATSGPIVTYSRPGQSFHNDGMAADIVGYVDGKWTWNPQDLSEADRLNQAQLGKRVRQ